MMASLKKPRSANLARTLPYEMQQSLGIKARATDCITRDVANKIDNKHAITETYGVTIEQVQRYLQRIRQHPLRPEKKAIEIAQKKAEIAIETENKRTEEHRTRQANVSEVLDKVFGDLAKCEPDLWSHRAFLMLMGLAYEKLSTNEDELSTEELVKLTKALGDACKVQPKVKTDMGVRQKGQEQTDPIPKKFAEIVQQVYGTNFNETEDPREGGVGG